MRDARWASVGRALGDDAGATTATWVNRFAFLFLLFLARDRSFAIPAWFAHVYLHALARECHIAQTRKRLKNARETAL